MHWVVLANDSQREEFLAQELDRDVKVDWIGSPDQFADHKGADVYFDLQFEFTPARIKTLSPLPAGKVIVNSVVHTLENIHLDITRINAWPGFLSSSSIEASGDISEKVASAWGKRIEFLPDTPGFISARVVSMIINEAYMVVEQGISSREDIDTAMKLGTNYPYGPFEWASKIGLKNIHHLLSVLSKTQARFQPCALLTQEANRT
jgi:3-hydroxybutyryl-CoA dehydrogenase